MTPAQLRQRRDAGLIGGLQTKMRYGDAYLRELGKKGGRPRLQSFQELKAAEEIKNGGLDSRRALERLFQ